MAADWEQAGQVEANEQLRHARLVPVCRATDLEQPGVSARGRARATSGTPNGGLEEHAVQGAK